MPAALTPAPAVGLAAAVALGALLGEVPLLVAVLAVQALLVWAWLDAARPPGALGAAAVAAAVAVAVDLLLVLRDDARPLRPVAGVLALAVLAAMLHQLVRRDRSQVTESFAVTATLAVLVASAALLLPAAQTAAGKWLVAVAAVSVALAAAAELLPLRDELLAVAALATGGALGAVVGATTDVELAGGILTGAAAGGLAVAAGAVVRRSQHPRRSLGGALALTLVAPFTYVVGRILGG